VPQTVFPGLLGTTMPGLTHDQTPDVDPMSRRRPSCLAYPSPSHDCVEGDLKLPGPIAKRGRRFDRALTVMRAPSDWDTCALPVVVLTRVGMSQEEHAPTVVTMALGPCVASSASVKGFRPACGPLTRFS
jgi:hypothetical protein